MIDTTKMPQNYSLCLAKENECPLAATCLRSLAFRQLLESGKTSMYINLVNPYLPETNYCTAQCAAYRSNVKERYARGMKHIFDDVKQSEYQAVRCRVMGCFSCETFFYRSQKGTRLITPEEQARIAKVFKEQVGTEPKFDAYVEECCWK